MDRIEIFEEVVVDCNVTLKRWEYLRSSRLQYPEMVKSVILSWLNKAYIRASSTSWRDRKEVAKKLHDGLVYQLGVEDGVHIHAITASIELDFPDLDYRKLNVLANMKVSGLDTNFRPINTVPSIGNISFESIERIKFT